MSEQNNVSPCSVLQTKFFADLLPEIRVNMYVSNSRIDATPSERTPTRAERNHVADKGESITDTK